MANPEWTDPEDWEDKPKALMGMIEQVAQALYDRNPRYDQETDPDGRPISAPYRIRWDQLLDYEAGHHEDIMEDARAAIAAMREPTEKMAEAGRWPAEDDGPVACWQAMIDAALSRARTAEVE